MKVKTGFRVRHIANSYLAVPTGVRTKDVSGVITLSESGALLWQKMESDCEFDDLVKAFLDEYEVDEETAKKDIEAFIGHLREMGCLDE